MEKSEKVSINRDCLVYGKRVKAGSTITVDRKTASDLRFAGRVGPVPGGAKAAKPSTEKK